MLADYDTVSSKPSRTVCIVQGSLLIHADPMSRDVQTHLTTSSNLPALRSLYHFLAVCVLMADFLKVQPVCLRICSFFSSRGSSSIVRFFWAYWRFSRCSCLLCFSVGRLMDQFSWRKMLVLMAAANVRPTTSDSQCQTYHQHNTDTECARVLSAHTPSTCSVM